MIPLASLLLKVSVVLLIGFVANVLLTRSTASTRHLVWTATLVSVLMLPVAVALVPSVELAWLPAKPSVRPIAKAVDLAGASQQRPPAEVEGANVAPPSPSPAAAASNWPGWQTALISVYLLGAIVILIGPLVGVFRLWRIRGQVQAVSNDERWGGLIEGFAEVPIVSRRVIVACSSAVPVPMTWGVLRPVVLLPAEAKGWPVDERRHALLHELSHVERFDWFVQMMARLVCALYWFHPLVWLANRRLHLEAERACDDNVLMAGARSSRYADQLLDLARRINLPALSTLGAVTLARRHQLWVRIDSILDQTVRRSPMTLSRTFAVALVTVTTLLLVAFLNVVPAGQMERASQDQTRTLMSAVARGDHDDVRSLLDAGAGPDGDLRGQGTPLILAARSGDLEMVQLLLSRGADVNRIANPLDVGAPSRTALIGAASEGHLEVVSVLLDMGADVDSVPQGDPTAMMAAADHRHGEIVDLLIEHGADVNRVVRGDGSPLIAAARGGDAAVLGQLLDQGADPDKWVPGDENALYHSIRSGDVEPVQALLDAGADVDEVWPNDGTPLIVAAREGHIEVVQLLLDLGVDFDRIVPDDENALIQAAGHGHLDVVGLLISAGAAVNARVSTDGEVRTALSQARRNGHHDVVELLQAHGARE